MTRSTEFGITVNRGIRATQPDITVYCRRADPDEGPGPKIGLIVSKAVGNAVDRHRVSRQLRHIARAVIDDLAPEDRVVIRALAGSRGAASTGLDQQVRAALERIVARRQGVLS